MNQVPITIKIDQNVKQQAQKLAKSLGLSLSTIVENKLKEVIRDRRVVFEEPWVPSAKTATELDEIQEDIKHGRNLSETFTTVDELETYLHTLGHAD